jgi:hypothetical protein
MTKIARVFLCASMAAAAIVASSAIPMAKA